MKSVWANIWAWQGLGQDGPQYDFTALIEFGAGISGQYSFKKLIEHRL